MIDENNKLWIYSDCSYEAHWYHHLRKDSLRYVTTVDDNLCPLTLPSGIIRHHLKTLPEAWRWLQISAQMSHQHCGAVWQMRCRDVNRRYTPAVLQAALFTVSKQETALARCTWYFHTHTVHKQTQVDTKTTTIQSYRDFYLCRSRCEKVEHNLFSSVLILMFPAGCSSSISYKCY